MHSMSEIQDHIERQYEGHHLFDWERPRTVWFGCKAPVFLDMGSKDFLLRLLVYRTYGDCPLWCVQYVSKRLVIESNGGVYET